MFWGVMIGLVVGYALGYHDRFYAKPPPPMKGTYDSGEHEDRVDDYPEDWT